MMHMFTEKKYNKILKKAYVHRKGGIIRIATAQWCVLSKTAKTERCGRGKII